MNKQYFMQKEKNKTAQKKMQTVVIQKIVLKMCEAMQGKVENEN